ncbi:MAG TPA: polysaccharide deacetylase family protein, partial [Miltoncostaeaceae bacterium]|nr:polysaccharide deacetylase family protein [Miltoncostaeaceae bacterium]
SREAEVREAVRAAGLEGSVDLAGYVPFGAELLAHYRGASAFIHVSHTEGVPQVLFEAMGSGLPVVATDVGGVRRAVEDGEAALLVPPDDRDALVEAVLRLDDDPALRRGLARRGVGRARRATLDVEGARLAHVLGADLVRQAPGARARAVAVADRLGVPRFLNAVGRPTRVTVLAYHRVVGLEDVRPFDEGLRSATPAAFAAQMEWVANCFSVISVADLRSILGGSMRCPRRPLLITFDDGYADNYEHALPVLRRLGLPAVVFVATGAVDSRRLHWWDALAAELCHAPRDVVELPLIGPRSLVDGAGRKRAHTELRAAMKRVSHEAREEAIVRLRETLGAEPLSDGSSLMITWEQARRMVSEGVDLQPHTVSHAILPMLEPPEIRREIRGSVDRLRELLGTRSCAFAYPNGDWDPRVVEAVRQEGLEIAFTMRPGPVSLDEARRHPLEIPRVSIEAADDRSAFRLKASGVLPLVLAVRRALARA